ncbi:MAG: glycosyltransferase family 4 protein [Gemmatimonadaceae bacterium]
MSGVAESARYSEAPSHPERVRVCIVAPSLAILGGQAVQAQRLLKRLSEIQSLRVAFLPVNPRLPGILASLQRVKFVRTVVTSVAYTATLFRRLRSYDVVHVFSASYWSFVLAPLPAMIVAKLYGRKVVLNYRSGEAEDHLRRWRMVALPAMRLADEIVVPSQYLVDVFSTFGLHAIAIPNFVELEALPYRDRAQALGSQPVFLSNRNLEPMYNVACVLRGFAVIQRRLPQARLIVAGFGSEEARLRELARTLALTNTEFTGRLRPEDMSRLYDRADVYLNAPDIDNMPGSVLEAFAAGVPVVTTNAGGIPYIVKDGMTGLVVARDDAQALAAAALRLVDEPNLVRDLTSRARAECVSRYVWPAVRREWEALYHGLFLHAVLSKSSRTLDAHAAAK